MKQDGIKISDLWVTQASVRAPENVLSMVWWLGKGRLFDLDFVKYESNLIYISRVEGRLYLHDGHHRLLSKVLFGETTLSPSEYRVHDWSRSSYGEVDFDMGYVTPYDIEEEVRRGNLAQFKQEVYALPDECRLDYIKKNRHTYCERRGDLYTVRHLADRLFGM